MKVGVYKIILLQENKENVRKKNQTTDQLKHHVYSILFISFSLLHRLCGFISFILYKHREPINV